MPHCYDMTMKEPERQERIAEAVARMEALLDTLDQLGLAVAAAHMSMAVDAARAEGHRARDAPSN